MATTPKYQHPEYPACTWSGRGAKPYWVRQHLMEGRALDELLINKVTVTEKPGIDQAQLPGLPPIPKKRGRPATGNAMTAAERKRRSRLRTNIALLSGKDNGGKPLADLTLTQLIECYSRCMNRHAFFLAEDIAGELATRARRANAERSTK